MFRFRSWVLAVFVIKRRRLDGKYEAACREAILGLPSSVKDGYDHQSYEYPEYPKYFVIVNKFNGRGARSDKDWS